MDLGGTINGHAKHARVKPLSFEILNTSCSRHGNEFIAESAGFHSGCALGMPHNGGSLHKCDAAASSAALAAGETATNAIISTDLPSGLGMSIGICA